MQYGDRIRAVQRGLHEKDLPATLITDPSNISYLAGVHASDALLLVRRSSAVLFLDGRYTSAARESASGVTVAPRADFVRVMCRLRRCGFEEKHVTVGRLAAWEKAFVNCKFVHVSSLTQGLRRKKDAQEITAIRRALSITDAVLAAVPDMLTPGVTERALAASIVHACVDRGADGIAFDTIVAFGPSTCEPHHRSGMRRLRARDIVQIDMGATYEGYCSDRSEVFFVGKPTPEQRRVHAAVLAAKDAGTAMVIAGVACADIDRAARDVLRENGLEQYFVHSLGHGLGVDIHEAPSLSQRSTDVLQKHDVVTVEPGVYIPGKFGIRLEDTVFVK